MQVLKGTVHLSASNLVGHLNCHYLTQLDLRVAKGALTKPFIWDSMLEGLIERGRQHEQGYIDHLKSKDLAVTTIDGVGVDSRSVAQTIAAIRAGAPAIVQAALQAGQ